MNNDFINALCDTACGDRDDNNILTFKVETHCVDYQVKARHVEAGTWNEEQTNWTPGKWEIIEFTDVQEITE